MSTTKTDTKSTPQGRAKAGDVLTFLRASSCFGDVYARAARLTLTAEHIEESLNLHGVSWIDVELAPEREDPRVVLGDVEIEPWLPGSTEWRAARKAAMNEAWAAPSDAERRERRAAVLARFGPDIDPMKGQGTFYKRDPQLPAGEAWT